MKGMASTKVQPRRQLIEIQQKGLNPLSTQVTELKQKLIRLISEIQHDHYYCDDETAWEIALGNRPPFAAFQVKGLLEVTVSDVLCELETNLREAAEVTDAQLFREWHESRRQESSRPKLSIRSWVTLALLRILQALQKCEGSSTKDSY